MKIKCRILSVFVVTVSIIVGVVSIIFIANKPRNKNIYAEQIAFKSITGGVEISINNCLVVANSMLEIKPNNCTYKPEFTIKQYGDKEENIISVGKHSFAESGRYILSCKVKASENYYLSDSIIVRVVDTPSETTDMYITPLMKPTMHVEDEVGLDNIVKTTNPANAEVNIVCNNCISINNNVVTAISEGIATIDITLNYDNIIIMDTISFMIKPKTIESNIKLVLSYGANLIEGNTLEVENNGHNIQIGYKFTDIDNQLSDCYTDSNNIQVLSHYPPTIIINPIKSGEANIYVRPLEFPDIIFTIVVKIV